MPGASVPSMLVACAVGLAVAAAAFRVDRRVAERFAALAGDSSDGDRSTNLLAAMGRSAFAVRFRQAPSTESPTEARLGPWTPAELAGVNLFTLVMGAGVGVALIPLWPPAGVIVLCALPVAMRAPAMVLRRKAVSERGAIDGHVLELVEVLLAAIEAGLPPATSVERTAGLLRGPLGREVDRVGREIALGLDWRAALAQSAARSGSDSLAALSSALGRAHRLGTSPRTALRALATELRAERRSRAEERARRAPVKMLFPLVLLILPAFLLLTVGPVLMATIRSLH